MILNLFADAPDPITFRDQINASLAELTRGLSEALCGDVITFNGPGVYKHTLGVKPIIGLVTTGNRAVVTVYPMSILEEKDGDWGDNEVYIGDIFASGPPYEFMQILLIGVP